MIVAAKPRILLIGAGAMGSRHARVIAQSEAATLSMVVDPRESFGRALAEQFGSKWAPNLDSLDNIHEFDGAVIAAATEAHHGIALKLMSAKLPLLIEKPVADSLSKTLELLDLSSQLDLPLMCGFVERFNPAIVTARPLFDSPKHVVATRHSPYAPRIVTGVGWDLLVHDVDLLVQAFGAEPIDVTGLVGTFDPRSRPEADDIAEALMRFPGGGVGHVSASRISQRKVRSLWVHDLDKLIDIDLLRRNVTIYRNVSDQTADESGRGYRQETIIEIPEIITSVEPLMAQFAHFMELLAGRVDAGDERASIVTPHSVVAQLTQK